MQKDKKEQKVIYSFEIQDGSKLRKFAMISPNRKMRQKGELFYTAELSKFISAGVLPKAIWEKMIKNNGGSIAEPDRKDYAEKYQRLIELSKNIEDLASIQEKTEQQKNELMSNQAEVVIVRREMQDLESEQISLYENTAEAKARNQSIMWWTLNLAHEADSSGVYQPILKSDSFEDKYDEYDEIFENNSFLNEVIKRINYLTTIWYIGAASSKQDFENFDKEFLIRDGSKEDESVQQNVEQDNEEKNISDVKEQAPLAD